MRHPIARRSGFTLIELLIVITIIGILAGITFGLFKSANNGRNKAKAKGDIQAISMACQSYRKAYGDFPGCASGADDSYRKDLLDQLLGRRLISAATPGAVPTLLPFDDSSLPGGSTRKQRGFLNYEEITTNDNTKISTDDWRGGNPSCFEFRDPWDNAYDYRYRVLTAAKYTDWKSPNFLCVSCGINFAESAGPGIMPDTLEYWDPATSGGSTMTKSGIVPGTYFDQGTGSTGPFRADNIVNWTN